jgi:sulfite reductase alpha subunit-like flavoprotein
MPFPLVALIPLAIAAGKGIEAGFKNRKAASKEKKANNAITKAFNDRTPFEIPKSIGDNVSQAENDVGARPAIMDYMEENANQQLANNISAVRRNATSSSDAMLGAMQANNIANQGSTAAAIAGQNALDQSKAQLQDARKTFADYKTMQWDLNINQPFLQRLAFAQGELAYERQRKQDATNRIWSAVDMAGQVFTKGIGMMGGGAK